MARISEPRWSLARSRRGSRHVWADRATLRSGESSPQWRRRFLVAPARGEIVRNGSRGGCSIWRPGAAISRWRSARLPEAEIIAADFSPEMLDVARRQRRSTNTVLADALQLPFPDGIIRLRHGRVRFAQHGGLGSALREMSAVLRSSGHVLVLDFSLPDGALRPLYRFYLHRCLPILASLVTGQKGGLRLSRRLD